MFCFGRGTLVKLAFFAHATFFRSGCVEMLQRRSRFRPPPSLHGSLTLATAAALSAQKILSFYQRPAQAQPPCSRRGCTCGASTRSQGLGMSLSRSVAQYTPPPKSSLKPTAVASIASRGARAEGKGSFAAEASLRCPSGRKAATPPEHPIRRRSKRKSSEAGGCKKGCADFFRLARRDAFFARAGWALSPCPPSKKASNAAKRKKAAHPSGVKNGQP